MVVVESTFEHWPVHILILTDIKRKGLFGGVYGAR
jgi:hypothetical protein